MRFLLSIHDVWPGNFPLVGTYLARLRSLGAQRIALLVVPAYHGAEPMDRSREFISWLREESAAGTELFLHGYHHAMIETVRGAEFRGRRGAYGRWVNRNLVAREAEFCGLPAGESLRLLDLGLASWARTGLPLAGFVAPTWHGTPDPEVMKGRGIPLRETRFRLERLADGRARFAPPLAWDQSRPDRGPVLAGGDPWLRLLLRLPLIKVAIHPGDFEGRGALAVLESVFAAGAGIGYADAFGGPAPAAERRGLGNVNATSGRLP
jgi:predicted deacetylase